MNEPIPDIEVGDEVVLVPLPAQREHCGGWWLLTDSELLDLALGPVAGDPRGH